MKREKILLGAQPKGGRGGRSCAKTENTLRPRCASLFKACAEAFRELNTPHRDKYHHRFEKESFSNFILSIQQSMSAKYSINASPEYVSTILLAIKYLSQSPITDL